MGLQPEEEPEPQTDHKMVRRRLEREGQVLQKRPRKDHQLVGEEEHRRKDQQKVAQAPRLQMDQLTVLVVEVAMEALVLELQKHRPRLAEGQVAEEQVAEGQEAVAVPTGRQLLVPMILLVA